MDSNGRNFGRGRNLGNDIHRIHLLAHAQGMRLLGSICISGRARGHDVTRALKC